MHYFEEEYQRRFKDAESSAGINPDQLWEDIAQDLASEPKSSRPLAFWWWLLPLLLAGVGGSAYWLWPLQVPPTAGHPSNYPIESFDDDKVGTPDHSKEVINIAPARTNITPAVKEPAVFPAAPQAAAVEPSSAGARAATTAKATRIKSETTGKINQLPTTTIAAPINQSRLTPTIIRNNAAFNSPSPTKANVLASLPTIAFTPISATATKVESVGITSSPTPPATTTKSLSWEVAAGLVTWHDRFADEEGAAVDATALQETHHARGGYQLALLLRKDLKGPWSVSTGLQFSQVYNTFDWTRSWDTVIYRNNIPGSDLINAEGLRRVKHQNELRWVQLPVQLGYEMKGKAWNFGVETGLGFNYLLTQRGRTLQNDVTVFTFTEAEQGPYNQFFLSTQVLPYLSHKLGQQTQIRLQAGLHYQWHGRSEVYQLRHQSVLTNLRLSFTRHL